MADYLRKNYKKILQVIFSSLFLFVLIVSAIITANYFEIRKEKILPNVAELPESDIAPTVKNNSLTIRKLNIETPIIINVDGTDKNVYNEALSHGVAHYKGTALPGKGSNIFVFGHSSSSPGDLNPFGEIFKDLNDLEMGDRINFHYNDKNYVYSVSEKRIIEKTEVSVLNPTKSEQLTLMTCWPIGTNLRRLIIIAKPI